MAPAKARSTEAQETRPEPTPVNGGDARDGGDGGAGGGEARGAQREAEGGWTVELPFVSARFHKPDLHLPRLGGRQEAGAAADAAAAKVRSLSPADLAYYAGLGVLGAVEVIEWPVALAVAAGTALARRGRDGGDRGPGEGTGTGGDRGPGEATGSGGGRASGGARAEGSGPGQ
jgi:hypothetical protein